MAITPEEFRCIGQFMREHSGIDIQPGKEYLVEGRLTSLLAQHGCQTFTQLCQKLVRDTGPLRAQVIDALTTHETLWFRDESFFSALADVVLPQLLEKARRKGTVRIWSAATATGQEAYSLAMLLDSVGRKRDPNFNFGSFFILGTDISASSLEVARKGRYNQMAMSRGMRPGFLERYFTRTGDLYEVIPEIRQAIQFKPFNLKDSFASLGQFDLILCRNVLIYFAEPLKRQICERIQTALLRPNGYFAIGASESLLGMDAGFRHVAVGRAVLYQVNL